MNALLIVATSTTSPGGQAASGSEALTLIAEARTLATRADDARSLLRAAALESHLLEGAGEHERAARVARQGMRDAEATGLARAYGTFLAINLAEPLIALGRWDEALEVIERALELSPPTLHQSALQMRQAQVLAALRGIPRPPPRPGRMRVERCRTRDTRTSTTCRSPRRRPGCGWPRTDRPPPWRRRPGWLIVTICRAPPRSTRGRCWSNWPALAWPRAAGFIGPGRAAARSRGRPAGAAADHRGRGWRRSGPCSRHTN